MVDLEVVDLVTVDLAAVDLAVVDLVVVDLVEGVYQEVGQGDQDQGEVLEEDLEVVDLDQGVDQDRLVEQYLQEHLILPQQRQILEQ